MLVDQNTLLHSKGLGGPEEDHQLHHCCWTGRVGEREEEEEEEEEEEKEEEEEEEEIRRRRRRRRRRRIKFKSYHMIIPVCIDHT